MFSGHYESLLQRTTLISRVIGKTVQHGQPTLQVQCGKVEVFLVLMIG